MMQEFGVCGVWLAALVRFTIFNLECKIWDLASVGDSRLLEVYRMELRICGVSGVGFGLITGFQGLM